MTGTAAPEVLRLADSVDYQQGAVVSRQITKTDGGNVTLFAFDSGQELSEHTTPFDALVHVLDGEAEVRIGGKPYVVHSGEALIMPAGIPHAVRASQRFKMLLTMSRA